MAALCTAVVFHATVQFPHLSLPRQPLSRSPSLYFTTVNAVHIAAFIGLWLILPLQSAVLPWTPLLSYLPPLDFPPLLLPRQPLSCLPYFSTVAAVHIAAFIGLWLILSLQSAVLPWTPLLSCLPSSSVPLHSSHAPPSWTPLTHCLSLSRLHSGNWLTLLESLHRTR